MTAPQLNGTADTRRLSRTDPAAMYLQTLGAGSRRTMREAVEKLARLASDGRLDAASLPWHGLRFEHTSALQRRLARDLAPATANKHLAALRGVLKQCWRLGTMTSADYHRAIDVPSVKGQPPRPGRHLSADDLRALATACESDESPAGARDAALLFGACLRRSEVVVLDLADYDRASGNLTVRRGGTGARRTLVANREARLALERWLEVRGDAPGPLFAPINKGGRIQIRRLSQQAIYVACHKRAKAAGLPPVSPEDLRRAMARRSALRVVAGAGASASASASFPA